MWEDAREMGQHANTEVYGLFAAHISPPSLVNYEIRKAHSTASQALTSPSPFARARARD